MKNSIGMTVFVLTLIVAGAVAAQGVLVDAAADKDRKVPGSYLRSVEGAEGRATVRERENSSGSIAGGSKSACGVCRQDRRARAKQDV